MIGRPWLLILLGGAAALATVANGVAASPPEKSRLGVSIGEDLGVRDKAATQRNRALDIRERAAAATERRLKADLAARQAEAAAAANAKSTEDNEQYDELSRIYQAMKPARAALVFEQLDMDVQMRVAQRMRDRSTALILGGMTPQGAAALSMALARKRPVKAGAAH